MVLLSVRPQHAAEALQLLRFGREHTVLSAMAGIPVDRVRELIPGAGAIHRIMPSSFIEAVRGPIPLYPAAPALMSFLAFAGEVVTLSSEHAFEMAMIAACFSTGSTIWLKLSQTSFLAMGLIPQPLALSLSAILQALLDLRLPTRLSRSLRYPPALPLRAPLPRSGLNT